MSPEVEVLHENVATLRERVEALEKRFSAMESRMTHIDRLLMEVQGEIRMLSRKLETLSLAQNEGLSELRSMMQRTLDLLQPKVTLPTPVAGG